MVGLRSVFLSLATAFILVTALPASSQVVSSLGDSGPGTLRQAVLDANLNPGADVITFQAGLTGTILLTTGEIAISDSVDIQGPGARSLAVDSTARIFNISGSTSVNVAVSGLTLTGGQATGNGGAIANAGANVTLSFVTVSGNNATGEGGALFHNANSGWLTIESSTLSGNTASKAGAIYSIGWNLIIRNSTISGNHATDSVGAIKLEFAYASISNSTITGNSATFSQGGLLLSGSGELNLASTIVAGNTDTTGASDLVRFAGTVNASDSLFQQALAPGVINGADTANMLGVNPMLGAMSDNGGPTDTHALPLGSPAIDAGANPLALSDDQRGPGFVRVFGTVADIGAFEFGSGAAGDYTVSVSTTPSRTPYHDGSVSVTVTGTGGCVGTFDILLTPVPGSGPQGTNPPATSPTTYTGVPAGTYTFAQAGAGSYTVTVDETSGTCAPVVDPSTQTALVNELAAAIPALDGIGLGVLAALLAVSGFALAGRRLG